jgi:hypothetical protein
VILRLTIVIRSIRRVVRERKFYFPTHSSEKKEKYSEKLCFGVEDKKKARKRGYRKKEIETCLMVAKVCSQLFI